MKDPALRAVSAAARGLWIDMLCLMFESPRRGYLQLASGKPASHSQIARMTGCVSEEVSRLLRELEDAGVFSRTEHGVIYSRRIARDEYIRSVRSKAGKKGAPHGIKGGRPKTAKTAKQTANNEPICAQEQENPKTAKPHFALSAKPASIKHKKRQKRQKNPPSSSSSSSTSTTKKKNSVVPSEQTVAFRDFIVSEYENRRECSLITDSSDWSSLANLLKACNGKIGFEDLKTAWISFLMSPDPFHQKQGHPLRYWCHNINAFIGKRPLQTAKTPKQKDILDLAIEQGETEDRGD